MLAVPFRLLLMDLVTILEHLLRMDTSWAWTVT